MNILPIVKKAEEHAKKVSSYEWEEANTPKDIWEFHQNLITSSDGFWYCFNNGYIGTELITDTPEEEFTLKDLREIERIVNEYGIEF